MGLPKKKTIKKDFDELPGERALSIDALAELTNSDVIQQVKDGLSRIEPLELDENVEGPDY